MNKNLIFSTITLFFGQVALAQEDGYVPPPSTPLLENKKFLLFAGGALFLTIVLIVKKIVERKRNQDNPQDGDQGEYDQYDNTEKID